MTCEQMTELIHAYADGELDLVKTLDVEHHIRDCATCAAAHRGLLALRSSTRDAAPYFRAPAALEQQIRSQIAHARATAGGRGRFIGRRGAMSAAAAIVIMAGVGWAVLRGPAGGGSADHLLASEVTAAHVRSLMAEHLWDVRSTDQHTVKPWFDGKLDFAPEVRDFKAESFALEGGRLDYLAGRAVAALVYRYQRHPINLFIWPAPGQADRAESVTTRQGYVLSHWAQGGMNYWAVTDANEGVLRRFTALVRDHASATTGPAAGPP